MSRYWRPDDQRPAEWLVIPALNEAATLRQIVVAALRELPNIVVVDDASVDATSRCVGGLPVVLLRNDVCQGKAGSLWRGFSHALAAGAEAIVTIDGDGQHDPRDIAGLLEQHANEPQALILGARPRRSRWHRPQRYLANCVADVMVQALTGQKVEDTQSGFRLYPAGLLRQLQAASHVSPRRGFVFESEVLLDATRLGYAVHVVPISTPRTRPHRASHFKPFTDSFEITKIFLRHFFCR